MRFIYESEKKKYENSEMISVFEDLEYHICPGLKVVSLDIHPVNPWVVFITHDGTIFLINTDTSSLILRKGLESFLSDQRDEVVLSKHLQAQYGNIDLPHWYYTNNKSDLNNMYEKKITRILSIKFFDGNISFWKMHNLQEVTYKKSDGVFSMKEIHDLDDRFLVEKKFLIISFTNRILMISFDEMHDTVQCCKELRSVSLNKQEIGCYEILCTKPIIAVGCSDGKIRFWDYLNDNIIKSLSISAFTKTVLRINAINRNDPLTSEYPDIIGCSVDGTVSLWNIEQKRAVFSCKVPGNVGIVDMLYQPERDLVVVMCQDKSIAVWELESFSKEKIENRKFWNRDLKIKNDTPRILSFTSVPNLSPYMGSEFLYVGVADGTSIYRIPLHQVFSPTSSSSARDGRPGLSPNSIYKLDLLGRTIGGGGNSNSTTTSTSNSSKKIGKSKGGSRKGSSSSGPGPSKIASRKVSGIVVHPHHQDEIYVITNHDGILHFRVRLLKSDLLPVFRTCVFGISRVMTKKSEKMKFVRNLYYLQMSPSNNSLQVIRRKIEEGSEKISASKAQVITHFPNFEKNYLSYVHLEISPSGRYLAVQFYEPLFQLYLYDCHKKFQKVAVHKSCRWIGFRLVDSGIDNFEDNNHLCLLDVKKKIQVIKNLRFQDPHPCTSVHGEQFDHVFGGRYICAVKYFQKKIKRSVKVHQQPTTKKKTKKKGKKENHNNNNNNNNISKPTTTTTTTTQLRVFSVIYFLDWEKYQVIKKLEDVPNIPKSITFDPSSFSFAIRFVGNNTWVFSSSSSFSDDDHRNPSFRFHSLIEENIGGMYWCGGTLFTVHEKTGNLKCYFPNFKKRNEYEVVDLTTKDIMKYSQLMNNGFLQGGNNNSRRGGGKEKESRSGRRGRNQQMNSHHQTSVDHHQKGTRSGNSNNNNSGGGGGMSGSGSFEDHQEHVESLVSFKPILSVSHKHSYLQILTILNQQILLFDRSTSDYLIDPSKKTGSGGDGKGSSNMNNKDDDDDDDDNNNNVPKSCGGIMNQGFVSISFEKNIFLKFYMLVQCGRVREALKWLEFLPNEVHVVLVEFLFKKLEFSDLVSYKKEILESLGSSLYLKFIVLDSLLDHIYNQKDVHKKGMIKNREKDDDDEEEENEGESDDDDDENGARCYIDEIVVLMRDCVDVLNEMKEISSHHHEYTSVKKSEIGEYYIQICSKLEIEMKKERFRDQITARKKRKRKKKKKGEMEIEEECARLLDAGYQGAYDCHLEKYGKLCIMYFLMRKNRSELKRIHETILGLKKKKKKKMSFFENELMLLQSFLGVEVDLDEKYSRHLKFE